MGHVLVSLSNREEGPGRKTSSNEKLFSKHRWYWSQLQLYFVGHTIVGDYTYSHRQDTAPYRMMLHAYRLSLPLKPLIDCLDVCAPDPFITDDLWQTEVTHARLDDFDGISWTKFWSFSTRWIKEWENILLCHTAENKTSELFLQAPDNRYWNCDWWRSDRKSTRLNSSHTVISYAVFCLKKKKNKKNKK